MNRAKYQLTSQSNSWNLVSDQSYDPAVHGHDLTCPDMACPAAVRYVHAHQSHAGSVPIRAHFQSVSREDHREGCPYLPEDNLKLEHNSISSLPEAIRRGLPILISANFSLGMTGYKSLSLANADGKDTPYNRFRQEHTHISLSAPALQDVFEHARRIYNHDPAALGRTWIAHCQRIWRFSHVFLGNDPKKFGALFDSAVKRASGGGDRIIEGIPHIFRFAPTKGERSHPKEYGGHVDGNALVLEYRNGDPSLILINVLEFGAPALRPEVLRSEAAAVMAVPYIDAGRTLEKTRKSREGSGHAEYVEIRWKVQHAEQVQPLGEVAQKAFALPLPARKPALKLLQAAPEPASQVGESGLLFLPAAS